MIDLAGSERAAQTQNTGKRMMEGMKLFSNLIMNFLEMFFSFKVLISIDRYLLWEIV